MAMIQGRTSWINRMRLKLVTAMRYQGLAAGADRRRASGFSLTELLVVVAIILIFTGIYMGGLQLASDTGNRETDVVLSIMRNAAANYASATGEPISHELDGSTPNSSIEKFVKIASQQKSTRQILNSLPSDKFVDMDGDGVKEVLDGWGRPLQYFAFNLKDEPGFQSRFMQYRNPYFGSPGKDGRWGNPNSDANAEEQALAEDNLYSFE